MAVNWKIQVSTECQSEVVSAERSYRKTHGLCILVDGSQGSREGRDAHSDENKLVLAIFKGLHHDTSGDFAHDNTSTSRDLYREIIVRPSD